MIIVYEDTPQGYIPDDVRDMINGAHIVDADGRTGRRWERYSNGVELIWNTHEDNVTRTGCTDLYIDRFDPLTGKYI